jgi:hypothetical protein
MGIRGEMGAIKMKHLIKNTKLLLWALSCLGTSFSFGARELVDLQGLKWAVRAGSQERPTMSAVLMYDPSAMRSVELKRLLGVFNKAQHNHAYRNQVDFLELNLDIWPAGDIGELAKLLELESLPLVALFNNGEFLELLTGPNLTKFRNLVNFVNNGFKPELLAIKHAQQAKDESVIRYQDYPPYYYGASFGEPFYSSYAGRQFYGGYYYPYSYSVYFNTAFFTSMAI